MKKWLQKLRGLLGGTFAPASVAIARRAELSAGEERKRLSEAES